jgi:nucleotide-binding universal stress UspA family protein
MLCVDGSEAALEAVTNGLELLRSPQRVLVVAVVEASDPMLVTGTGMAGGVMSSDDFEELDRAAAADGWKLAEEAAARLHLDASEIHVLRGTPGPALCALATQLPATAIVMGSRGRGGVARALLGSVSDYVVRNAPCPVVISRAAG